MREQKGKRTVRQKRTERLGDRKRNPLVIQLGFLFAAGTREKYRKIFVSPSIDSCLPHRQHTVGQSQHTAESSTVGRPSVVVCVAKKSYLNKRGMKDGAAVGSVPETSRSHKSSNVSLGADGSKKKKRKTSNQKQKTTGLFLFFFQPLVRLCFCVCQAHSRSSLPGHCA